MRKKKAGDYCAEVKRAIINDSKTNLGGREEADNFRKYQTLAAFSSEELLKNTARCKV